MASISTDSEGRIRILFVNRQRRHKSIWLGKLDDDPREALKAARQIKAKVEALVTAAKTGVELSHQTAEWLASISDELHAKLAAKGLVAPRTPPPPARMAPALGPFSTDYIASRKHFKPNTVMIFSQARRSLVEYFGEDRAIDSITAADAENWQIELRAQGYAQSTISTHVRKAQQLFKYAVKAELLTRNPFAELKSPQTGSPHLAFISQETIYRCLDAAPDAEMRLIIALSRFGGIRTPSETFALQWTWVDWEHDRMQVFAPKQEHLPKGGWRTIPIFAELRPYLEEAWDQAEEGAVYVISRRRFPQQNLRTDFMRIIRSAGLEVWPRLFHNLRASRQTELTDYFPSHVVAKWIGNTVKVADMYYHQVTEEHFKKAAQGLAQNSAHFDPKTAQNTAMHDPCAVPAPSDSIPCLALQNAENPVFLGVDEGTVLE